MKLKIYQVDAFTDHVFGGNPAAVCPLKKWMPDEMLQRIAMENNLSETAFYVPKGEDYELRWLTPAVEVDLCGHATLATAFVLFEIEKVRKSPIKFHSRSGILEVKKQDDFFVMNFPCDHIRETETSALLSQALGRNPVNTVLGKNVLKAELDSEKTLLSVQPDFSLIALLHPHGVIITSKGDQTDFVSRCFFPNCGIDEDPVTGSAHTLLTPYWSKRLGKQKLSARQLSIRIGDLTCELKGDRVEISGKAVLYMSGEISIA